MSKEVLRYKGFKGTVCFSEEDNCWYGTVCDDYGVLLLYEGSSVEELEKDFKNTVDSYIKSFGGL